jgi:hypothetical protein
LYKQQKMEAIKAIAKKTKSGKYKIDLLISNNAEEVEVMVIVNNAEVRNKKTIADFAGKIKTDIDWLSFQKNIRNEWE